MCVLLRTPGKNCNVHCSETEGEKQAHHVSVLPGMRFQRRKTSLVKGALWVTVDWYLFSPDDSAKMKKPTDLSEHVSA